MGKVLDGIEMDKIYVTSQTLKKRKVEVSIIHLPSKPSSCTMMTKYILLIATHTHTVMPVNN